MHHEPSAATESTILRPGQSAPDFTLQSAPGEKVSLAGLRGRPVVLIFYPADWSPVCGDELALFNELVSDFKDYGAELIGISVDGVWCHAAFARERKLQFPLLADFEPKGSVSRAYGAYHADGGTSQRALFLVDQDGVVQWSYLSPMGVNPGADGVLSALERLVGKGGTSDSAARDEQRHSEPRPESRA
jgi:peroxiredoxin